MNQRVTLRKALKDPALLGEVLGGDTWHPGAAKKLKLIITAGMGSDHIDLQAAMDKGISVAEITFSNSISVAEHVVMMILALVRNYIPAYGWVIKGCWNYADAVERSSHPEWMVLRTVA